MKSIIAISLIAALATVLPTPKAQAINQEWAAVAGFVGGYLFSSATSDRYCEPRRVYYEPTYTYQPTGYYRTEVRRYWTPGYYDYEYTECGSRRKYWVNGYWSERQVRVWVHE